MKKTWGLINELRGKVKKNIKASFFINGQLVEDKFIMNLTAFSLSGQEAECKNLFINPEF